MPTYGCSGPGCCSIAMRRDNSLCKVDDIKFQLSLRETRSLLGGARYTGSMMIHNFAFRWKPGVTEEQKTRVLHEVRGLQGQIPGLLETNAGFNLSPRSQGYEFGGSMKFADEAALAAYNVHPVHQELVGWLMPLIEAIEVDFEA